MTSTASTTQWIEQIKEGDTLAEQRLWDAYYPRLVGFARRKLAGTNRVIADEEDVALSVFKSLFMGVRGGRFPKLSDRSSLWSLLVAITAHKSVDLIRRENRLKRGGSGRAENTDQQVAGGIVPSESPSGTTPCEAMRAVPEVLSHLKEDRASVDFSALMSEQFELLIKRLDASEDQELLTIAIGKMLGESTSEIASWLNCSRRTVERKTQFIRQIWEQEIADQTS